MSKLIGSGYNCTTRDIHPESGIRLMEGNFIDIEYITSRMNMPFIGVREHDEAMMTGLKLIVEMTLDYLTLTGDIYVEGQFGVPNENDHTLDAVYSSMENQFDSYGLDVEDWVCRTPLVITFVRRMLFILRAGTNNEYVMEAWNGTRLFLRRI